jgi:hypothetical protein
MRNPATDCATADRVSVTTEHGAAVYDRLHSASAVRRLEYRVPGMESHTVDDSDNGLARRVEAACQTEDFYAGRRANLIWGCGGAGPKQAMHLTGLPGGASLHRLVY